MSLATSPATAADAVVIRAAAVMGLVWLGDALIYVVLPVHAEAFGIGLGLVGGIDPSHRTP